MAISRDGALMSVMVLMSLVDGEVSSAEVMRIVWVFEKLTGRTLGNDDVVAVARQVHADKTELKPHLELLGAGLSLEDRRDVLKAAFAVASADGKVVDAEDAMMLDMAKALRIDAQDYSSIASHMMVAREFG